MDRAHKELAPATMTVVYEFPASPSGAPPVKLVWHQGNSKPPGWVPEWGGRSQLFIGDKGMLLGNGKLLPEEKFKDFQAPPETLPRSPGHWVEWVNYAKGVGPVPGSNFQYSGLDDRGEPSRQRRLSNREEDRVGLQEPAREERAGGSPVHQAARYRKGWNDILRTLMTRREFVKRAIAASAALPGDRAGAGARNLRRRRKPPTRCPCGSG